jgi:hypothetical protein
MKPEDKAAWLQACNEFYANSGGKDLGEYMFKAAIEHRDKQAGKPVLWLYDFPNPDNPDEMVLGCTAKSLDEVHRNHGLNVRPLGYLSSAVAVNEQMLQCLKEMVEVNDEECWTDHHGYCQAHNLDDVNDGGCRVANAKAAITAAEAAKGGV